MASLNKPDQTGPYCTPILCVLRVTRAEIKSYYSTEPCDMHKEHEVRLYILRTGAFWISSTCFYTGLAFPLPLQALLTERHVAVHSDQQQEGDPLFCSNFSASRALWNAKNDYELATGEAWYPLELCFASICWRQKMSELLVSSPGFRQGCALVGSLLPVCLKHGLSCLSFSFLGCY